MELILIFILSICTYFLSIFFKKKNYITNFSGDLHQKFIGESNIPLLGGFFILTLFLVLFKDQNIYFLISSLLIFFLGIFSDLKIISSPKIRILLQTTIVAFLVYFSKLEIESTRIIALDSLLTIEIINYLFVCFCIIILINGTNFIDGLNGLVLGYFLIILFMILVFNPQILNFLKDKQILYLSYFLLILLIFNFCNLIFIGDNGSYVISLIFSFLLIMIYKENPNISPYYIILLIWYPCFELLFSIIRKFNLNSSPIKPDTNHLHQLIFYLLKIKFNLSSLKSNNISSLIILLYNFFIIFLGSKSIYNTQLQIILIILSALVYTFVYNFLLKYKKN